MNINDVCKLLYSSVTENFNYYQLINYAIISYLSQKSACIWSVGHCICLQKCQDSEAAFMLYHAFNIFPPKLQYHFWTASTLVLSPVLTWQWKNFLKL